MANQSILAAFERMWQHIAVALGNKSNVDHSHSEYYTKQETNEQLAQKSQVQIITWEDDD